LHSGLIELDIYNNFIIGMRKLYTLRSWFLAAFVFIGFLPAQGQHQVSVFATQETGDPGEIVKVGIKVAEFDSMVSAQFSLLYDTMVVEYSAIGDFGIFNITNENFGVPNGPFPSQKGVITFLWIADNIITGQYLPDSTLLFSISFKIIGSAGQVSPVQFSEIPTELEFGDLSGEIPYTATDGSVTVAGGSATKDIVTADFVFPPVAPNPVGDEARISFSLREPSMVSLRISDHAGRTVFHVSDRFGSGPQTIRVGKEHFPVSGTYYANITTENAQAVQKLIVIR